MRKRFLNSFLFPPFLGQKTPVLYHGRRHDGWNNGAFLVLELKNIRKSFGDVRVLNGASLRSDDLDVLSWPWEALYCDDDKFLAQCCIERQLLSNCNQSCVLLQPLIILMGTIADQLMEMKLNKQKPYFMLNDANFYRAMDMAPKLKMVENYVVIAQSLASFMCNSRNFSQAKLWYKKSLEIFLKQGDEHNAAKTYSQLGDQYSKYG
ncbi:MAG: hypothetical protein LBC70_09425 [Chitinispirillales bacterium]|nr:hypothetical protein [Chitinispirillales bacterium]